MKNGLWVIDARHLSSNFILSEYNTLYLQPNFFSTSKSLKLPHFFSLAFRFSAAHALPTNFISHSARVIFAFVGVVGVMQQQQRNFYLALFSSRVTVEKRGPRFASGLLNNLHTFQQFFFKSQLVSFWLAVTRL